MDNQETGGQEKSPLKSRYLKLSDLDAPEDLSSWWAEEDDASLFQRGSRPLYNVHWSVGWADLMMTMFILFLIMFAYKNSGHDFLSRSNSGHQAVIKSAGGPLPPSGVGEDTGGGRSQQQVRQSVARMYDFSKIFIKKNKLRNFAAINLTPDQSIKIILTGDLLFDPGQAKLKPAARISLQKMASLLAYTPYHINIIGHTDNNPIHSSQFPSNWELSASRAAAVARFLVSTIGLQPDKISISGQASFNPIAKNDNAAHRALNRRVEIIISRPGPKPRSFYGNAENLTPDSKHSP
ncbi:Flagellar motor rotation protein MotB [hydrothermal vent metagenome]|uniref:Flagellar motor rotation protein MotB n=1 Tax=hydrothermal vent metagenome TaxID=652676 RepID=A0A3B0UXG1_9ZZZZ